VILNKVIKAIKDTKMNEYAQWIFYNTILFTSIWIFAKSIEYYTWKAIENWDEIESKIYRRF